jgi:hypothetical protein
MEADQTRGKKETRGGGIWISGPTGGAAEATELARELMTFKLEKNFFKT